jgi:chaperone required for assembly of F1-ATPase
VSDWKVRKVFWTAVTVRPDPAGWAVALDGKPIRTPAKAPLILPNRAMADAVAAEWAAQRVTVDPATMPVTRYANSAIDRVAPALAEVAALVSAYGASDHLCYRAFGPVALLARQTTGWDPVLDWAATALGARLAVGQGVVPVAQDPAALVHLTAYVLAMDPFRLAAFHDLVAISGSLVLALAVTQRMLTDDQAWALSRIDEEWQVELWGHDAEADHAASQKHAAFLCAARFFLLMETADTATI